MNKKLIRLTESDLHKIVKESVKRVLSERKLLREFGYDHDRQDLVGMDLRDVISQLETEGWKWSPTNEKRIGDKLKVILYPTTKKTERFKDVWFYLECKADDENQNFIVIDACECYN